MIRLFLSTLFLYCISVEGQPNNQYVFRHLDQRDGLLHNSVLAIQQDKRGFMWISTPNGLQRYDGLRFKNYKKELTSFSYALPIINIDPVDENNVWVTGVHIAHINTIENEATVYDEKSFFQHTDEKFVSYTDQYNHKWLLNNYSLYNVDTLTGQIKLFKFYTPTEASKLGNIIFHDSVRNCTWVTSYPNLMMFDEKTKRVYTAGYNPINNPILKAFSNRLISFLLIDKSQNIWAAEWGSTIYKYDNKFNRHKEYLTVQKLIHKKSPFGRMEDVTTLCMYQDSHGTIWIGNDQKKLFRYNVRKDKLEIISGQNENEQGLQYNYSFICITEDKDGNLWLGTDRGINVFNPYNQYFYTITHQPHDKLSLPKKEITSFIQGSNGLLYVGTWGGGITIYDSSGNYKKSLAPKGLYEFPLVWSFIENDDKTIWVGAQHGYIHVYNPVSGKLKTIHPVQMENKTIVSMKKDRLGNIWFGLYNGQVVEWEKKTARFVAANKAGIINQFPVKNIFIDNASQIWASTDNGLLQFDPVKHAYISRHLISENRLYQTYSNEINGIEQQNDSVLVAGTMGFGLFYFNIHSKQFARCTAFGDLTLTNIYAVKKDADNNLWLSSDYHLYKLQPQANKLFMYDIPAGLMNASFELFNIYALQNGNWVTASKTELLIFNTEKMASNELLNKKVVITGFKIFDQDINVDSLLYDNKPIHLKAGQNFITIEFTTHSYSAITKNIFYKLSGIDKKWVKASDRSVASYTNLAPGDYHFIIKAGAEDSYSPVTTLELVITPPFYYTWWFKGLLILTVALLSYFFVLRRIQNIRYKAELRHKVSETEMLALRSQMNPHFIFNCLSAIDNLIQTNQPDKATTYLARFGKLIRSVLESTKHNIVPFYKDFETLQLYIELEQFRAANRFSYHLSADEELMEGDYKVPPLLVQPFVENAIHHGLLNKLNGERNLTVHVSLQSSVIHYLVKDNGVGRAKAQEIKQQNRPGHNSYGIAISSERIKLHNQDNKQKNIEITDLCCKGNACGTQVEINIKI